MLPLASHTAPQSGSGIFHRWSKFQLFAVAGGRYQEIQKENRSVSPFCKVTVMGGFLVFHRNQRRGHFSPPGVKSGVNFFSALTATAKLAGQGGDMRKNLYQSRVETPESKNAKQHVATQHKVRTKIVRSSPSLSAAAQSSAQKSQPADP